LRAWAASSAPSSHEDEDGETRVPVEEDGVDGDDGSEGSRSPRMPPSAEPQSAQEYIISEERKACRTVSNESTNVTDVQEHVRGRGHCSDRSLPLHSDALARGSGQTARSSIRRGRWRHDEASSTCTACSLRYRAIAAAPMSVDMLCEKQSHVRSSRRRGRSRRCGLRPSCKPR
jgi:hypothetical protein